MKRSDNNMILITWDALKDFDFICENILDNKLKISPYQMLSLDGGLMKIDSEQAICMLYDAHRIGIYFELDSLVIVNFCELPFKG